MARRYAPLGGSSRRYRDTRTGQTISYRQYRQRVQLGGRTMERVAREERRAKGTPQSQGLRRYDAMLKDYKDELARQRGYGSWREAQRRDPAHFTGTRARPLDVRRLPRSELDRRLGTPKREAHVYTWEEIPDRLSEPRRTKAEAQRFMKFLSETLGRHVTRSWEAYIYKPGGAGGARR